MTLNFTVNKPINEVFEYLTDMQKLVSVHPIIFRIDKIKNNEYLVFEKLKMLFIPVVFKYKAIVEGNSTSDKASIKATVMGMIHITMNYELIANNGQTNITEYINFRSVLPVHFAMKRIFKVQHEQLFLNIDRV